MIRGKLLLLLRDAAAAVAAVVPWNMGTVSSEAACKGQLPGPLGSCCHVVDDMALGP